MDLFELVGTIAIRNSEANRALDETGQVGQQTQSKLSSAFSKVGSAAVKVGKVIGAGMVVAGTAVAGLVTKSVQSYAEYEQLVGGVETLFGAGGQTFGEYSKAIQESTDAVKEFQKANGLAVDGIVGSETSAAIIAQYNKLKTAQDSVFKNANEAYKTAGMSANAYMETVTGFSASLISSVGGDTVKAAALADQAIIDMSDNANKMGTDMESIQNAYQGFAKQNYTINLMSAA